MNSDVLRSLITVAISTS